MGSPNAPMIADVFLNYALDQATLQYTEIDKLNMMFRYVDDLFLTFSCEDAAKRFFDNLNSIHKSIKFTREQESNSKLAFLHVLITRKANNQIETSVFRKTTHTGLYLKYNSFVPNRYKRNLVNSLLQRAYNIGSSYHIIHKEFEIIKKMLARNGYPPSGAGTIFGQGEQDRERQNRKRETEVYAGIEESKEKI